MAGSKEDTSDLVQGSVVKVKAEDPADDAIATNTFGITWHLPYEKYQDLPAGSPQIGTLSTLTGTLVPGEGVSIHANSEDFDLEAAIDGAAVLSTAAGQTELALVFKIASGLSDLLHAFPGTTNTSGNDPEWKNDDSAWVPTIINNPGNIDGTSPGNFYNADGTVNRDKRSYYNMQVRLIKRWHQESWLADKYGAHGYETTGHNLTAKIIDSIEPEAFYTLRETSQ